MYVYLWLLRLLIPGRAYLYQVFLWGYMRGILRDLLYIVCSPCCLWVLACVLWIWEGSKEGRNGDKGEERQWRAYGIVSEKERCSRIVLVNMLISSSGNGWLAINEPEQKTRTETTTPTQKKVWVFSKTIFLLYVDAMSWIENISRLQETPSTL